MSKKAPKPSRDFIFNTIRAGRKVSSPYLSLTQKKTNEKQQTDSTFVFIVPAIVSKKSSDRNLIKRRARHIIRTHKDRIVKNQTIVFYFKKPTNAILFKELEKEMIHLLIKENLYA